MKKKLLDILLITANKIENLHLKLSKEKQTEVNYTSLSPINNGDEKGHYSNALRWAINNRKKEDIKNIALTGPYGSGKSTILKTFKKNYKEKDLKFLNISLASFKDEKTKLDENGMPIEKDKEELLRLIETSILQQIFYHEKDKNIPDSRFKKIKSYSIRHLVFVSLGILFFIIALLNYFYPFFIKNAFKDYPLNTITYEILHYGSILIILVGIFFLIYKSIRIISSITINKLKFQSAEIGIGESLNKSILNHHLDEILYFFTIRPYNVVIIEDLDRFEETEIFTKLREINLLLNESKKTKNKNIVFIYAVRDDMFSDNDRIKFFDFIIPVIPVINSSNSGEIILYKKNKYNYNLTDTFIEDISFFIDDMRLLHNITNEFYLYKVKQSESPLNEDKLFAMITYKNIYPNDFVALSKNEGELYKVLNSKLNYSNQKINLIEEEILLLKKELKNLDLINIKNINELRLLYVVRIMDTLEGFDSFVINDIPVSIDEVLKDKNFEYLKKNNLNYKKKTFDSYYGRNKISNLNVVNNFDEIQKLVNSEKKYNEREKDIIDFNSGKSSPLKIQIQNLEKEKIKVRSLKISTLLQSNEDIDLKLDEKFDEHFITILIRNGYISEDYLDYISLFHEGSITRNDHRFIINVRNKQKLEFDYKLTKIEKIVSKINPIDFDSKFILNYDLLDFLLKEPIIYKIQLDYVFNKLKDESSLSVQFIDSFIDRTESLSLFIKTLCNYWFSIWRFYENDLTYTEGPLKEMLEYIIEYADIKAINEIEKQSNLTKHLLKDSNILNIISNNDKLRSVITELKLKFNDLDFENSPESLLDFIYQNNYYQINKKIIPKFIKKYGEFEQISYDISNYSSLKNSKAINLINYIEANIDNYIENLYLKLDSNVNEEQKTYIELLNNPELSLKLKKDIVKKVSTKISEISIIENTDFAFFIIDNNKIEANWENLLCSYNNYEGEISESTINFINSIQNAKQLSKSIIPEEVKGENIFEVFIKDLLLRNDIDNEAYDLITKLIPWWYSDLNLNNLDEEKIHSLIHNRVINPTKKSFDYLKENFDNLNIKLLEKHKSKFIELIEELVLDENDLRLILESKALNNFEKNKFLNVCTLDIILSKSENIKLISQLLINDDSFKVNESIFENILQNNNISILNRIKIYNKNLFDVNELSIEEFLKNLDINYGKITNKNKKAKLEDNINNRELLNNLIRNNYISSFSKTILGSLIVNHKRK
ncbi:hypothetical protein [Polaribacter vadi]|uniref:YobI family P-loop NTPase n=1 Tax=Polaribacter vadi TaxID=1774273 RepID=UPI0030EF6BA4